MPTTHRVLVHDNGPALWPQHKSLAEVQALEATTPEGVWYATYQGEPRVPGGVSFRREWWNGQNRYDASDPAEGIRTVMGEWATTPSVVARFLSLDTANKDKIENAYTAVVVGDLLSDYRLALRWVHRERLELPSLVGLADTMIRSWSYKLRNVVIEDRASGTSLFQTLNKSGSTLGRKLVPFQPTVDKVTRYGQAAVWCKLGCVLLPYPHPTLTPWLLDFEDEIFSVPNAMFLDQADAFSQLILFVENYLAEGHRARQARNREMLV